MMIIKTILMPFEKKVKKVKHSKLKRERNRFSFRLPPSPSVARAKRF
jgi:hypothetical protein